MLNKLLKRCMPWMAKGRWYKIAIVKTGVDEQDEDLYGIDPTKTDNDMINAFYGARRLDDEIYVELRTSDTGFLIKDFKSKSVTRRPIVYSVLGYWATVVRNGDFVTTSLRVFHGGALLSNLSRAGDVLYIYVYAEKVIL